MKNQDKLELKWSGGAQKVGTAREVWGHAPPPPPENFEILML